ncbi:hypothetical protein DPMN_080385, partial [Dreissena polymorpha]
MGTRRLAEYWGVVGGRARHLEYSYQIQLNRGKLLHVTQRGAEGYSQEDRWCAADDDSRRAFPSKSVLPRTTSAILTRFTVDAHDAYATKVSRISIKTCVLSMRRPFIQTQHKNWQLEQYTDLTYFHIKEGKPKKTDVFDSEQLTKYHEQIESNDYMAVDMPDPFQKPSKTCLLCQHNIKLDYKNTQSVV